MKYLHALLLPIFLLACRPQSPIVQAPTLIDVDYVQAPELKVEEPPKEIPKQFSWRIESIIPEELGREVYFDEKAVVEGRRVFRRDSFVAVFTEYNDLLEPSCAGEKLPLLKCEATSTQNMIVGYSRCSDMMFQVSCHRDKQ